MWSRSLPYAEKYDIAANGHRHFSKLSGTIYGLGPMAEGGAGGRRNARALGLELVSFYRIGEIWEP